MIIVSLLKNRHKKPKDNLNLNLLCDVLQLFVKRKPIIIELYVAHALCNKLN